MIIKTCDRITADQNGKTVYLGEREIEVSLIGTASEGFAKNGSRYIEVSESVARKIADGVAVAAITGHYRSVAEGMAEGLDEAEVQLHGSSCYHVTGRGKPFGGKIRLYVEPIYVI